MLLMVSFAELHFHSANSITSRLVQCISVYQAAPDTCMGPSALALVHSSLSITPASAQNSVRPMYIKGTFVRTILQVVNFTSRLEMTTSVLLLVRFYSRDMNVLRHAHILWCLRVATVFLNVL